MLICKVFLREPFWGFIKTEEVILGKYSEINKIINLHYTRLGYNDQECWQLDIRFHLLRDRKIW